MKITIEAAGEGWIVEVSADPDATPQRYAVSGISRIIRLIRSLLENKAAV